MQVTAELRGGEPELYAASRPPPLCTVKTTVEFATGPEPKASETETTKGWGLNWPAIIDWLLPLTMAIDGTTTDSVTGLDVTVPCEFEMTH